MTVPATVNVKSLLLATLAKPGQRSFFHLMATLSLGAMEAVRKLATDYVLVIDRSGSTANQCGDSTILETAKDAATNVVDRLEPTDRLAVVAFSGIGDQEVVLQLTNCDDSGKVRSRRAINALATAGATAFAPALELAQSLLAASEGRQKVVIFFTDGENVQGADPVPVAEAIKNGGTTLYLGGLGVQNKDEQLMEAMGGANFRGLNSAADVAEFFAAAQADAASANVTNAQLRVNPVGFAKVNLFELVTRGNSPSYVPANGNTVAIGNLASGDVLKHYLQMEVTLPADIKPGQRSFGKVELIGDVPGLNLTGQTLASGYIKMDFTATPMPDKDQEVEEMINLATTARELFRASQATNAGDVKKHAEAADASARRTRAFSQADVATKLAEAAARINQQAAADPDAAAKQARRATRQFSASERAELLRRARERAGQQ